MTSKLSDTKAVRELKTLEKFYKMLLHQLDRSPLLGGFSGVAPVEKAADALTIDTLLIKNKLFRH